MSLSNDASNSSVPQGPKTLLDVKVALGRLNLKPAVSADLRSALHAVAKSELRPEDRTVNAALARIPVDARILAPRLNRRVGARHGYTRESWSSVTWRVRKALHLTGASELLNLKKIELSAAWREAMEKTPRKELWYMAVLGRWGTIHNVDPQSFRQEHVPQFYEWLLTWKETYYARRCYFRALEDFNNGVAKGNFVGEVVDVPNFKKKHYSVPKHQWGSKLVDSVDRIISKFKEPDLDEDEKFERVEPRTADMYRVRLFRTLSAYVVGKGIDPSSVQDIAELINPPGAKIALDYMLQWARRRKPNVDRTSEIHGSAKLIATIAERCYQGILSGDAILTLQRMARNRAPVRNGMTGKNRAVLKLFDDEKFFARFLDLPFKVFKDVLKRPVLRRVDAVKLMLAFGVAQSCEAPLRPENQTMIVIDEHIRKVEIAESAVISIQFSAEEVKTSVDLDFELAGDIVRLYDTFLERARPLLCEAGNRFLYPGQGLRHKSPGSLSPQIARFLEDELGVRLTGQQFRHVIGYVYLKANPGDYEVVRQLLGHKDITTTMSFYAALDMRAASKKVSAFLAQRRKDLAPLLR